MSRDALTEIELNIQEAKKFVELGRAIDRLTNNRDFKKVILEGYFREEAIRLVHAKGDPALQSADKQAGILSQIDAISNLRAYFSKTLHQADMAAKAIEADEQTREELLAEGLDD